MITHVLAAVSIAVVNMVSALQGEPARDNEVYPLCSDWESTTASDNCANPQGNGITIKGERFVNCSLETRKDKLCFVVEVDRHGDIGYRLDAW